MMLPAIVLLPLLAAFLPMFTRHLGRRWCALLVALPVVAALGLLAQASLPIWEGGMQQWSMAWLPSLGLNLALRLDGLALLFCILILGIGLLVVVYAHYYLPAKDDGGRFYTLLLLFMFSMLGVVTSDNLLFLVFFWELTSLSSFLLISYKQYDSAARKGARMALTVTGMGGLALLAGVLLIGHVVGSFSLSTVLENGALVQQHALYPVILCLVLLGAFTKSAQFPFHFWLPHAMAAPTPVSAYLHSATMVKAGIFLLARFYPVLAGTDLWFYLVTAAGMATLLWGAIWALFQHDLKGLLAFSTISHLGLITLLFGLNSPLAAVAGVFHIINHATFKAGLFMAAGIIDQQTGTRDMRRINGLWKYMPYTAVLAMVASAAMAGVPLLNGFLSKEMFFTETLQSDQLGALSWLLPLGATLGGVFSVAYSARFIHDVFFNGEPVNLPKFPPREPPRYMKIPVEILVALCVAVGVFPAITVAGLLAVAATATLGGTLPEYHLAVWHGLNIPLLMSVIAMVGGIAVYACRRRLFAWYAGLPEIDAKQVFEGAIQRLVRAAAAVTRHFQNGSLQGYVAWVLAMVAAVLVWQLPELDRVTGERAMLPVDGVSVLCALMLIAAALLTTVLHRQRMMAIISLSVVGLIVSLIFVRFSAPDLALTQLSVEVVSVLLMMLAMYFLPARAKADSNSLRVGRDVVLAGLIGTGVAVAALLVMTTDTATISPFFLENSVPGGGGTNVVNVILVDFRGFDTFGEITVLGIAALGIYALLSDLKLASAKYDPFGRPWAHDAHPLVLVTLSRPLLPLALMIAVYIFLRGHNLPGGGFVAGLITSVALLLQYVASGVTWVHKRIPGDYHPLVALGVLLAGLTGVASWAFDSPFLTSTFTHVHWPLVGDFELASAMLFDTGVFLTVVGATLLILANLGKLSLLDDKKETT
ncbi:multisubunit potassium/proton antiporter, PhaA subunit /multisubunit potassium/proton antiporter, PhaB subunit [Alcanivorax sp. DSM 26293]|uniref:monovalent cation/H+ antiporter subunit A n=1 Tax=Alcanivorax sp. DSM 26293 TaxID=1798238 RepID=UPI00089FF288|nr:monovalent cation/H+ antiporter subunit A [Alcanivorax sp. DSM 26293]SEF76771.1 multisubunit potassium/proton antiporter, PhaA subunit /multisubunit potassium/proton antiporter, PhaB subunit [Alcanivorax sp. DSM 26293]